MALIRMIYLLYIGIFIMIHTNIKTMYGILGEFSRIRSKQSVKRCIFISISIFMKSENRLADAIRLSRRTPSRHHISLFVWSSVCLETAALFLRKTACTDALSRKDTNECEYDTQNQCANESSPELLFPSISRKQL